MNRLFILLALITMLFAGQAGAASLEAQNYRRAFAALDAGHADLAMDVALREHDTVLNKVIRASYMGSPGNNVSFADMAAFIAQNPSWPNLRDILMLAEQKMPENSNPSDVANWFETHPPVSLIGFYRYIDALNALDQSENAYAAIKKRWIQSEFTADELTAFYARFGNILSSSDVWARLDHVLWNNAATEARRLYNIATPAMKADSEARLAMIEERPDAEELYEQAAGMGNADPGLLYERLRWLRRNDRDEDALNLLAHPPSDLEKPESWWNEREILIHRLMDRHDYNLAYSLAADHGQTEGRAFLQAEFVAGWLALRFLDDPSAAHAHFVTLYESATTPIVRARGAYWLGRTQEASGDMTGAASYYAAAATFDTTFYGQLAETRIEAQPVIMAQREPEPPAEARARFNSNDLIRATERLHDIGEKDRARSFFHAALTIASNRNDFVLLTELANRIGRPDLAIEAAKEANKKNIPVEANGFPILGHHIPTPPEAAFTQALIRQESMFNPEAQSGAGAIGLMQLMPHTAEAVARQIGMKFREAKLADPDYNVKLGTAFITSQIDRFDGSYVLALAGYNAGAGRVHEWLGRMGDPRDSTVDPIDWIEMIPVAETRNYVQRIIESLQIYRAKLNGGHAPLLILQDLKR